VLLGMIATTGLAVQPAAAAPSPSPSTPPGKPSSNTVISISGPTIKHTLTFRQDKQPAQYAQLLAEVSWMDGLSGDVIDSTATNFGPHFLVVRQSGSKVIGRYDLYPEVAGGPRAHRQALSGTKEAWFYAPVDMASTLAALGVAMPTSVPSEQLFVKPTVAPTSLKHSLSAIARESVTALVLAALGCVAVLVLLAFAARRSHSVDRRRTLPPAIGRLASVTAKAAAGQGAVLRGATPPRRPGVSRTTPNAPQARSSGAVVRATASVARAARLPMASRPPRQSTKFTAEAGVAAAKRVAEAKRVVEAERAAEANVAPGSGPAAPRRTAWRALLPSLSALPRPRKVVDSQPNPSRPGAAQTAAIPSGRASTATTPLQSTMTAASASPPAPAEPATTAPAVAPEAAATAPAAASEPTEPASATKAPDVTAPAAITAPNSAASSGDSTTTGAATPSSAPTAAETTSEPLPSAGLAQPASAAIPAPPD
jgi:hypothetical protein